MHCVKTKQKIYNNKKCTIFITYVLHVTSKSYSFAENDIANHYNSLKHENR